MSKSKSQNRVIFILHNILFFPKSEAKKKIRCKFCDTDPVNYTSNILGPSSILLGPYLSFSYKVGL